MSDVQQATSVDQGNLDPASVLREAKAAVEEVRRSILATATDIDALTDGALAAAGGAGTGLVVGTGAVIAVAATMPVAAMVAIPVGTMIALGALGAMIQRGFQKRSRSATLRRLQGSTERALQVYRQAQALQIEDDLREVLVAALRKELVALPEAASHNASAITQAPVNAAHLAQKP